MFSSMILPLALIVVLICAWLKKIDAYGGFISGVKEGWGMFNDIFPAMLSMMLAVNLLEASGLMGWFSSLFSWIDKIPSQIWPMVLFRPISGTASLAILQSIFNTVGVDSFAGILGSIIQGSTDTTFYVITLYFASVGIKKIKNSLAIGLISDVAGIAMAILLSIYFFS